ncbi:hypothetical protein NADFUDRAFT_45139 [Nadsonia fulvescens var. elongata DSM 6958]|uniref:WW domain-containing protein n=1 Tax=Nadsonia fulvescens var. elongata DSM 6958 TaxID=857566 RepID=A0A1E3PTQ1_9ASCO|nr:hypothetical protein NADFUDRAFT_45139 [Nadsonia fulvescens var. elongata DSM 6958]
MTFFGDKNRLIQHLNTRDLEIFPPLPEEPVPERPADVELPPNPIKAAVTEVTTPIETANTATAETVETDQNQQTAAKSISLLTAKNKDTDPQVVGKDDGWSAIWDDTHGAYYFYNQFTQETTWANPRVRENEQTNIADKSVSNENICTKETPESLEAEKLKSMTTYEKYQYLKEKTEKQKRLEEEEELHRLQEARLNITINQKPKSIGFNPTNVPFRISKKEAHKIKTQKSERKEARMREWLAR